ncbi:hypothetical protein SDC9_200984 [bioreactor metagenome]|uniref:2-amino-4-hydroxy-6-hydroxymethyldihydropteridine diphosphokinase n=1 Tax=bioreactor metagenome TaxID=1076179 RepID=A0A645IQT1_9ZZZZ
MSQSAIPKQDNFVYLSLGSNVGDRMNYLTTAVSRLSEHEINVKKISPVYETDPVDYVAQDEFLNCCVLACTSLSPLSLLDVIHSIENELGRTREIRFGPRTIDIDILLFNHERINSDELIIPHPRMFQRAFVLVPLAQIIEKSSGAYCKTMSIVYDKSYNKSGVRLHHEIIKDRL